MKLNCDLGESFGSWTMGHDEAVMPFIDQANIACGFHAGDPVVLARTLALAKEHNVMIGAHPGYPDLNGFGRRSMKLSENELRQLLHYQISAVAGMAKVQGQTLKYVKPHGALYNDMMNDRAIRQTIMQAVADYPLPLTLMLQATTDFQKHKGEAHSRNLSLWFEAFADRAYQPDGQLVPRSERFAVHSSETMLAQVDQLLADNSVTCLNGTILSFPVDTLCVHGDNEIGVKQIQKIRDRIHATDH